jgi:hypothetical protein
LRKIIFPIFLFFSITNSFGQQDSSETILIYPEGQKLYTAQMHLHGYSNHNGSGKPGSLQWHSKFADSTNTDIIWWSEHRPVYEQDFLYEFKFTNGIYDSINNVIVGLSGNEVNPIKWIGNSDAGIIQVDMTSDTLNLNFSDVDSTSTLIYCSFVPRGTKGKLKGLKRFVRPLVSKPMVSFDLSIADNFDVSNSKIYVEYFLSYHLYDQPKQQKLIYNFTTDSLLNHYEQLDSSELIINHQVLIGNNEIILDIENDAQMLKDGKDNVIQDMQIKLKTKNNKKVEVKFSHFQLSSIIQEDSLNYLKISNYLTEYKNRYKIQQILGTEITMNFDETTHFNAFLPDSSSQVSMWKDELELNNVEVVVPQIHSAGGVVSLNHPFGTNFEIDYETQEFRTDTMAQYLLNISAFGCDIIEVGYLQRGGVDINHHLKLWDILTANQLYLYGNGVSDLHGGDWIQNNVNFVTYLWADDSSATNLIKSIKKGKFYFGDERIFKDKFFFSVGTATMGDRVIAESIEAPVHIKIDNIPANAIFKLTQGLIQPGLIVEYLYNDSIIDWQNPPCLNISQPNFVRLSMFIDSEPVFYSNPIVFTGIVSNPTSSLCIVNSAKETVIDLATYKLFPIPSYGELNIELELPENRIYKISILDSSGKLIEYLGIYKFRSGKSVKSFPTLLLASDNYFLLLESKKHNKTISFSTN